MSLTVVAAELPPGQGSGARGRLRSPCVPLQVTVPRATVTPGRVATRLGTRDPGPGLRPAVAAPGPRRSHGDHGLGIRRVALTQAVRVRQGT